MVENPDIVANISSLSPKPFTVGFAAETTNMVDYAREKLNRKNLDMVIANDVSQVDIGFNSDDNAVVLISKQHKSGEEEVFNQRSKQQLARDLISRISIQMNS